MGASLVDSLSDGDGGVCSLSPITGRDHSLSLILGLALVALVLTRLGTTDKMTTSLVVAASLAILSFLGVETT